MSKGKEPENVADTVRGIFTIFGDPAMRGKSIVNASERALFDNVLRRPEVRRPPTGGTVSTPVRSPAAAVPPVSPPKREDAAKLHLAVRSGDIETCRVLLAAGVDPDVRDGEGLAPLHHAVMSTASCGVEIVDLLLASGADPNVQDRGGISPLHLAASFAAVEVIRSLITHGASPSLRTTQGRTSLHTAAMAARHEICAELLRHGSDPNVGDADGYTALHFAAQRGCIETCRILIEGGADPLIEASDGRTAVVLAKDDGTRAFFDSLAGRTPRRV